MSILGRAAKAAFRTTWGAHDSDAAQAFRWSIVGEDYEAKARAALRAALDMDQMSAAELIDIAKGVAARYGYDDADWLNGSAAHREIYVQMVGKVMMELRARIEPKVSIDDRGEQK